MSATIKNIQVVMEEVALEVKVSNTNSCMIDMIAREAVVKNRAKLRGVNIETIPFCTTYVDTLTGARTAHAEMLYHYNNDTWHYTNSLGSTRIFKNKKSFDIKKVADIIYTKFFPKLKVEKVLPIADVEFF